MFSSSKEVCIEAINLRSIKLNGFKLLVVYSREYGLLKLSGSKLGGRSEPFVHNLYWIGMGSEEIHRIKQSEFQDYYREITSDFTRLSCASTMAEILEQCTHFHEEQSAAIFGLFRESLTLLNHRDKPEKSILLNFLWRICELIGYGVNLRLCGYEGRDCALSRDLQKVEAWLDLDHGGISCSTCTMLRPGHSIEVLPNIYQAMLALKEGHYECTQNASTHFLINLLLRHIQNQTDRKLKSVDLLKDALSEPKALK
ncbi:MAG: DNA repair protein RecO C-terminal domain-containing protein [Candidatus Caenarcaniphilales bacterium]|nr:DNA repair protein RecO C-terminal domain-containing protein [Candidatus Caenarcaniphilales bacterium]